MGEKLYRPIIKEGNYLLKSKSNPERVRGLTRDANNQNPDIIEWEECDEEQIREQYLQSLEYDEGKSQLTPEQKAFAQELGTVLGNFIVTVGSAFYKEVISPWWAEKAWPNLKNWCKNVRNNGLGKEKKALMDNNAGKISEPSKCSNLSEASAEIGDTFNQFFIDMDESEAREHIMKIIYHMLEMANEIRIMSNASIKKNSESEEERIEGQKEAEKILCENVAKALDDYLSKDSLDFNVETSRQLFSLTGGGIHINGKYVPVQVEKINVALEALPYRN